jgi:hypothetical protein
MSGIPPANYYYTGSSTTHKHTVILHKARYKSDKLFCWFFLYPGYPPGPVLILNPKKIFFYNAAMIHPKTNGREKNHSAAYDLLKEVVGLLCSGK